jgi:ABC-type sulfate transport system permease component
MTHEWRLDHFLFGITMAMTTVGMPWPARSIGSVAPSLSRTGKRLISSS